MHETHYSNFIARQIYTQKYLKYRKIEYWLPGKLISDIHSRRILIDDGL